MSISKPAVIAAAMLLAVAGCNEQNGSKKETTRDSGKPAAEASSVKPAIDSKQPEAPADRAAVDAPSTIKGKIAETMNSGGYTYMLIENEQGKTWVAVPETTVTAGQEVEAMSGMVMPNFKSSTLKRTFESLVFSNGLVGDKPKNPHAMAMGGAGSAKKDEQGNDFKAALNKEAAGNVQAQMGGKPEPEAAGSGGSSTAIVQAAELNIEKASGDNAYRVGELFEQGEKLDNKTVKIRGKVMKISRMIMGKNWLHIQDGTGNALKNTHDLVVTTMAAPAKGDIVIVEGALHAGRDFGMGYRYDVIVEDAEVQVEKQ